jgi:hypothetical protein
MLLAIGRKPVGVLLAIAPDGMSNSYWSAASLCIIHGLTPRSRS